MKGTVQAALRERINNAKRLKIFMINKRSVGKYETKGIFVRIFIPEKIRCSPIIKSAIGPFSS
jgi:hypothetical protein